jgi:hypothetical protein
MPRKRFVFGIFFGETIRPALPVEAALSLSLCPAGIFLRGFFCACLMEPE